MRDVLVLTPDFPPAPGGIQTLMHSLLLSLERYQPWVVTLGDRRTAEFDRTQPFAVTRVWEAQRLRHGAIAALNVYGVLSACLRRPHAVLSAHIVTGVGALAVRRLLGVPAVQYVHAQELNRRPRLARAVLPRVDATIAVSRHTESLALTLAAPPSRLHVIHPGVHEPPLDRESSRERKPWIIVVSRLVERYKGHDVLLRALPLVRSRVPNVHLHVIGNGPLRGQLEALAHTLAVSDYVTFHGTLDDPARDALLREAAVFAMVSRTDARGSGEGFGIVYLEAGRFGLPVVAGRVAGALDAVVDGETGILVDPRSHIEAADALITLLCDADVARRMGDAGRRRAAAFSWRRAAYELERVLDHVVDRP